MPQFFTPMSLRGVRRNFNSWIANLGDDGGLKFAVDPASAEKTLMNFFAAFDRRAAELRAKKDQAAAPVEDATAPPPSSPTSPTSPPVVSPSVRREGQAVTYSLAPETDPYSTSLLPGTGTPVEDIQLEEQAEKAKKILYALTGAALLFML